MAKIGLVLSGGGARGFAQLGVLKVLKKNNIRIDAIAGCSVGALIGGCYAYNQDPEEIEKLMIKMLSKRDIYDFAFSTKGIIKGDKLAQYISEYLGDAEKFEQLKIPLAVNATDIVEGKELVFDKGPLVPALMASMSYPGFFTARKHENHICVDGGVTNPLPISLLKDMDYLILVDVAEEKKDINEDSNIKDIVLQATLIMQRILVEHILSECTTRHVLIKPDVESQPVLDFKNAERLIKIGEEKALSMIAGIKKDLHEIEKDIQTSLLDAK